MKSKRPIRLAGESDSDLAPADSIAVIVAEKMEIMPDSRKTTW